MTDAERILWERVQRRAASLSPQIGSALLRGYAAIRDQLSDADLLRIVELGADGRLLDEVLSKAAVDLAMAPARDLMRNGLARNAQLFAVDIPGKTTITTGFDILNTRVIEAVRRLESKVITNMSTTIADTLLAYTENGIRDGVPVRAIARELRGVIGLAPNQAAAVSNFRRMLESGDRDALSRLTRDARFDGTLEKALGANGKGLSAEQIDVMSKAQRARMIAFNTETLARTSALDTVKLASRLTWEDAASRGIIDRERVRRTWAGVMDERERPAHRAMEGQTRAIDAPYSNGQMVPGDSDYTCRCVERFFLARA